MCGHLLAMKNLGAAPHRSDMKYRKLRLAWSVAWGVVAVLLCILWVRSYWSLDLAAIHYTNDFTLQVATCHRGLVFGTQKLPRKVASQIPTFEVQSVSLDDPRINGLDL